MEKNNKIDTLHALEKLLREAEHVKLYGAGLRLASFMEVAARTGMRFQAECVLVSSEKGNPETACGLPVMAVSRACLHAEDTVILTISDSFAPDARKLLAEHGVTRNVYDLDYAVIDRVPYDMVYRAMEPFIRTYPERASGLNPPVKTAKKHVWSCWWQGEETAPELVRKCWESQRGNIPAGAEHVIITWENYRDYIELPEYIVRKAERGKICPAHLSDILRCCLLYRYGGIWLDATVYMTGLLPESCFIYEILTRSTGEKIYCTNVSWVTWFLGGRKGEGLYRFLMEAFFAYFKEHDEALHYYMIDFLIAAACRELAGTEEKFRKIPVNNVRATELQKHLHEVYDEEAFRKYTDGGYLQKLTYKESGYGKESFYGHLMKHGGNRNT